MVKFLNDKEDLSRIEIVITDFGLSSPDSKGGTPIFASPSCLANPSRKAEFQNSDIFSLGRVFLFLILSNEEFIQNLFVPITNSGKKVINEEIQKEPIYNLIQKMMKISKRRNLNDIRKQLDSIEILKDLITTCSISKIIDDSITKESNEYIANLKQNLS